MVRVHDQRYLGAQVARLVGITVQTLCNWRARHGWPKPIIDQVTGHPIYFQHQVDEIMRLKTYLAKGWTISEMIEDGEVVWPGDNEEPAVSPCGRGVKAYGLTRRNPTVAERKTRVDEAKARTKPRIVLPTIIELLAQQRKASEAPRSSTT